MDFIGTFKPIYTLMCFTHICLPSIPPSLLTSIPWYLSCPQIVPIKLLQNGVYVCMNILLHLWVKCVLVCLCFSCHVFSLFFHPPLSLSSLWNYSSFLILAVLTLYLSEYIFTNMHLTIYLNLDFMCKRKYTMFLLLSLTYFG